ncbi:MAG: hypothetical protein LC624_08260 [Halobacteriales archaeon]|nr:hypothetical protein [Halobacteriales archaeon]
MRAWPLLLLALLPLASPAVAAPQACGPFTAPLPGPWACQLATVAAAWSAGIDAQPHPLLGKVALSEEVRVTGPGLPYRLQCAAQGDGGVTVTACRACEAGSPSGQVQASFHVGAYLDPSQLCTSSFEAALLEPLGIGVWTGRLAAT